MILRRLAAMLCLGLLGAAVVYSLMMAFGDPALELLLCAAWMPLYLVANSTGLPRIRPSA
jgi:hypothetical protein